ncbi:JmjC domain-containing histone demethylation protein 1 [Microsporum audouinii]
MAPPASFGAHPTNRPSHYRTPSPPRHGIEPLSPGNPFTPSLISASVQRRDLLGKSAAKFSGRDDEPASTDEARRHGRHRSIDGVAHLHHHQNHRHQQVLPHQHHQHSPGRPGGHARSRSTIDTLATIALATSPTFSPLAYDGPDQPTISPLAHHDSADTDERPSKRAKSEKAPLSSWHRPATSHVSTLDSMKTDAELLLNFARPANSPPFPPHGTLSRNVDNTTHSRNHPWRGHASAISIHDQGNVLRDRGPSAWAEAAGMNGVPPARLRSQSDGAAVLSRPSMNALLPDSIIHSSAIGPVLEDDQEEDRIAKKNVTWMQDTPTVQSAKPSQDKEPTISGPQTKHKATEGNSTGQTNCAACNRDRIPVEAGGDDTEVTWVNCDGCDRWFHIVCCGFNAHEIRTVDKFICSQCHPIHGPTTFVRKSTRPRTAIDYAGLNQGFVKPPSEESENIHLTAIKQGKISFLPDHFARMPPDLVTASYFERGAGMIEPIVIPAHMNSRSTTNFHEATTEEEFDENIPEDDGYEEAIDCGQDLLDMVIPKDLTVKTVGEIYGPEEKIEVIDVKSQQGEEKKWTMQRWMDYYYDTNSSKVVKNVISLEVSQSPLGRLLRRPRVVRDLDLQDSVWPPEQQAVGDYPKVQFYCLMSVADCYTDFHIDFGGSSVYYHILKGKKTFFFIPPKEKHLKKYDEWCNSPAQDTTFLGTESKECYRVDLSEGDTMLIPSGWIHAVWTPEDSLVIGGNFLTRMNYSMQLKITKMEKDAKVPRKFRYPFFQKIMWLTVLKYLADDPLPPHLQEAFALDENYQFYRETPVYHLAVGETTATHEPGSEYYNAKYYSQGEIDGLPELAKYILRTALIAGGYKVDGVTKETKNAVSRSIPKGQGDPVDIARKFGVWVAWKRGNEPAPQWTRPGAIVMDVKVDMSDKRRSTRPRKQSERALTGSQRGRPSLSTSQRPSDQGLQAASGTPLRSVSASSGSGTPVQDTRRTSLADNKGHEGSPRQTPKAASLGPKRVACDPCRKRRIKCRHKGDTAPETTSDLEIVKEPSSHGNSDAGYIPLAAPEPGNLADQVNDDAHPQKDGIALRENTVISNPPDASGNLSKKPQETSPSSSSSSKKGRIKACEECRKSKRRCIHDEAGRIDPIKIQEQPKTKRSRTDDEKSTPPKKQKRNDDKSPLTEAASSLSATDNGHVQTSKVTNPHDKPHVLKPDFPRESPLYSSPPAGNSEVEAAPEHPMAAEYVLPIGSLVSPPTSLVDDVDGIPSSLDGERAKTVDGERNTDKPLSIHTPTSISYHPSRYPPISVNTKTAYNSKQRASKDRTSAHGLSPSSPIRSKTSSRPGSSHRANEGAASSSSRRAHDRTSFAETDVDPDSIKLIRQLQEEDFGLRRRTTKPKP